MRLLVTGGAGFIGSHLVERLLDGGRHVRVLDNLSTGKLTNLPDHPALEFIEGDIGDTAVTRRAMQGCDAVVHLAAVASVQASVDDPVATHGANFFGTLNLLEAAREAGTRRFIYASSAAVYGDRAVPPVAEDSVLNPLSPYAADKLAGEHYLAFYARRFGLRATAFRFFNIFGPRQDPSSPYSGVISVFVNRALADLPVTIYGDGEQTRDFVYVKDLVDILVRAIESDTGVYDVMNVGRGIQSSLLDVLRGIEAAVGHPIERVHQPRRAEDIRHSCADNTRLRNLFGGAPQTPLHAGLAQLLQASAPEIGVPLSRRSLAPQRSSFGLR